MLLPRRNVDIGERNSCGYMGVSKKSVSWTSTFVTMMLQENARRSDETFLVQTFWTRGGGGGGGAGTTKIDGGGL